ncbi:PAS domain-containing hybrid sensor histidine kinase/response regulator [Methylobrevis albus]|uniref:histidine kinase n=1 Tax=Methylobrevis albus TaxID=2793297 RepID=A0A931MZ53_9HYPH|nr:ATP-binding protein [Methylobrevis albus]MBH0237401.1 response regulator [Methylobrevis albus]
MADADHGAVRRIGSIALGSGLLVAAVVLILAPWLARSSGPAPVSGLLAGAVFCAVAGAVAVWLAVRRLARALVAARQARDASREALERVTDELWEVRDREAHLASVVAASGDAVVHRTRAGEILDANGAFAQLFGLDAAEVAGRSLFTLLGGELAEAGDGGERGGREAARRSLPARDIPVDTALGTRWLSWTETTVDERDGGVIQSIGRDVTERKATEAALSIARDQAEAASDAKSRFLAMVSHEIRTPLNGILGMTNLLQQTALTSEQMTYAKAIETSGDALLLLIDDLLDFSKIEAGRLDLVPESTDVAATVEQLCELLAPRAYAKGIELAAYVDPKLGGAVMLDPVRLRQVLFNLIGNGIKFTAEGGVAIEVLRRDDSAPNRIRLLFQVRDTGIGVDDADAERIFREFEQADPGPARAFGGTGLGLAIARRLVRLMGGEIRLDSAVGAGACFSFEIAADADLAALPAPPPAVVAAPPIGGARHAQHLLARAIAEGRLDARGDAPGDGGVAAFAAMPAPARPAVPALHPEPQLLGGRLVALVSHALIEGPLVLRRLFDHGADVLLLTQQELEAGLVGRRDVDVVLVDSGAGDPLALIERVRTVTVAPVGIMIDPRGRSELPGLMEAGYGAYLVKPVRTASLLRAVRSLLGETDFEPAADLVAAPASAEPMAARRVLLCDDNEINALLGRGLIEKLGHQVVVAGDGRHAVAAVEDAAPGGFDIVFMDLHMPEVDGFEAARRIRAFEAGHMGRRTPIVALTADLMAERHARAEADLFDAWLAKPLQPDALRGAMRTLTASLGEVAPPGN